MRRWIVGVVLAASAVIAIGCGGTSETPSPSVQAVLGPWRAQPVDALDERLAAIAEAKCRAKTPEASGLPVVLHDQRGDGIDTVVFADANGNASCQVVGDSSGAVTWVAGGGTTGPATDEPGETDITIDGMGSTSGSDTGTVSDISGRVGAAIASLRILLDDGRQITATTEHGWFYAWWPGESAAISVVGDDLAGRRIASAIP